MAQKPGGVGIYTCDGGVVEMATSTCRHCARITEIPSQRRLTEYVEFCRLCFALICLECAGKPCSPWLKKIEEAEERFYRNQQFAKSMGF